MTYADQVNQECSKPHSVVDGPGEVALGVLGRILRDKYVIREVQHELRDDNIFLEKDEIEGVFNQLLVSLRGGPRHEDDGEDRP